jgi:hypothetical protein
MEHVLSVIGLICVCGFILFAIWKADLYRYEKNSIDPLIIKRIENKEKED